MNTSRLSLVLWGWGFDIYFTPYLDVWVWWTDRKVWHGKSLRYGLSGK
jgi:hypothetical protein